MITQLRPLPLQFWRSDAGAEPSRDWFRSLDRSDRATLGGDLRRLQYGWPLGMPLVKSLGQGLWELRSTLPSKREARALFIVDEDGIVILNAFIKKSQKTPPVEIALARRRLKGTGK